MALIAESAKSAPKVIDESNFSVYLLVRSTFIRGTANSHSRGQIGYLPILSTNRQISYYLLLEDRDGISLRVIFLSFLKCHDT